MTPVSVQFFDDLRDSEEANFRLACEQLGNSITLVGDVDELYDVLADLIMARAPAATIELIAGSHFLRLAQYHLRLGALDCLRCHLTDSFAHSRMGIEAAAFAARVARHPHMAEEWIRAGESADAYEKYRSKFSGSRALFPDSDPTLTELG